MAISTRQVKNKRDSNGILTGRPGTVYDVNIKYIAPDGKKKTYAKKGFATKKEATQHEAEIKTKLRNPGQIASITTQRKQTVAAYLNDWVESYARVNLRPSTYNGYKPVSYTHLHSEGLGHFPTSDFQPTRRRTGGRKYGKGYSFPMLAKKVFYLLCPYFPLRRKSRFAKSIQKKNAAICKDYNAS